MTAMTATSAMTAMIATTDKTLGILETGEPPPELKGRFDDYPQQFMTLFGRVTHGLDYRTFRVMDGDIPDDPEACDSWLITGSPAGMYEDRAWIPPLKTFIQRAVQADAPMVGVCFGHQAMAEALGGSVEKSEKGWGAGVHHYKMTPDLTQELGLQGPLSLNVMHQDQVVDPGGHADVLAGSEFCPYGVLRFGARQVSVQPHPEFESDYERALIELRRGERIPDDVAETALESLGEPRHDTTIARWLLEVMGVEPSLP
jgi:GMP synthase-like glutamine amidotransferase